MHNPYKILKNSRKNFEDIQTFYKFAIFLLMENSTKLLMYMHTISCRLEMAKYL